MSVQTKEENLNSILYMKQICYWFRPSWVIVNTHLCMRSYNLLHLVELILVHRGKKCINSIFPMLSVSFNDSIM